MVFFFRVCARERRDLKVLPGFYGGRGDNSLNYFINSGLILRLRMECTRYNMKTNLTFGHRVKTHTLLLLISYRVGRTIGLLKRNNGFHC